VEHGREQRLGNGVVQIGLSGAAGRAPGRPQFCAPPRAPSPIARARTPRRSGRAS
jgi:hypothetical protein